MIDARALHQIVQRLSLRKPQAISLERLADVVDLIAPSKRTDVEAALSTVQSTYPDVVDFGAHDFPNLCFALATGVGKTRLLGAFVSYLFMTGRRALPPLRRRIVMSVSRPPRPLRSANRKRSPLPRRR